MSAEPVPYFTEEEYLEWERHNEVRHEYYDGHVTAMAGASDEHELVAGNFFLVLGNHLRGKKCRVYKDGMRVRAAIRGRPLYYYPDVLVTCDPTDTGRYYKDRPTLVVEVLSEDKNKDLVEKYLTYKTVPSIQEYVIVLPDPLAPEVRIFRRDDGWEHGERHVGLDSEFTLRSVGLTVKVAELFAV